MDTTFEGTVGADGKLRVPIRPDSNTSWVVSQVSVEMPTAPLGATCDLRKNGALVSYLIATGDVAGGDPPVTITQSSFMAVSWAGCTPGAAGLIFIIYDEVPR